MAFTAQRLERLGRSLDLALNHEWPKLGMTTRRLSKLAPIPIQRNHNSSALSAIATVATDGGENCLSLEPMQLQVVRVADSLGHVYFEEFIPESLHAEEILRIFFKCDARWQRFMASLDLEWDQLLPQTELQRSHLLSMMRELMEWAALLQLAERREARLLIRDGLLRSVLLSEVVFDRLREQFETLTKKNRHLLVGVAKRSRVISYLSIGLGLAEIFASDTPAYLNIPPELEREGAPAQYRWIGNRAMGRLNVARLAVGEGAPLMPVDIADWQRARTSEAMTLLHECSRASFPMRGYPQPLIAAHESARLGGIEIEIFESLLLQKLRERDPAAAAMARELRLRGKQLTGEDSALSQDEI